MAVPSQRRQEFSFPGSPAQGAERALPPRPAANPLAPRAGEEDFRWLQASRFGSPDSGSGCSGTPSPQLWAAHQPPLHHRLYPASAGSSPSRAQAIAGYRREMLDLVRGLPESAYELSLRDIVESPYPPPPPPPPPTQLTEHTNAEKEAAKKDATDLAMDEEAKKQSGAKKQGRRPKKQRTMGRTRSRSLERSVSLDTGLLIKLFLPLSIGGRKKVSPKPAAAAKDAKKKKEKEKQGKKEKEEVQEEEWWKKSEFSEAGGSSRTSSSSSSNSNSGSSRNGSTNPKVPTRTRSRKRTGCYAFFRANKSQSGGSQD